MSGDFSDEREMRGEFSGSALRPTRLPAEIRQAGPSTISKASPTYTALPVVSAWQTVAVISNNTMLG